MKPQTPKVAIRRREAALANFRSKLAVLERLLSEGALEKAPARLSVASFAAWEDDTLGVTPVSRAVMYSAEPEYLELRQSLAHLLKRAAQRKDRRQRKHDTEEMLRQRLADAEDRAQKYVNQYSAARAELLTLKAENVRLREKLNRQAMAMANVIPLKGRPSPPPRQEANHED